MMKLEAAKQEFISIFKKCAPYKREDTKFNDFVQMCTYAIANRFLFDQKDEDNYLRIAGEYKKEDLNEICKLLGLLTIINSYSPVDFLGYVYIECNLSNSGMGQFFTPKQICNMLSKVTCSDLTNKLELKNYITVCDPCCGSGGQLISFINSCIEQKINYSNKVCCFGKDLDYICFCMTYIQLSLSNIPGVVVWGDTLAPLHDDRSTMKTLYTPAYFQYDWFDRLNKKDLTTEQLELKF